jgi:alpha/beta superfamily hydrolase
MEENVEICEEYIKKENPSSPYSLGSRLAPYSFGSCFANDIIYAYENILNKDKRSPKLNIKDMIEKLKYFSEDEGIDATKILKAKYAMLSWITNCLLEKSPNKTNNI